MNLFINSLCGQSLGTHAAIIYFLMCLYKNIGTMYEIYTFIMTAVTRFPYCSVLLHVGIIIHPILSLS